MVTGRNRTAVRRTLMILLTVVAALAFGAAPATASTSGTRTAPGTSHDGWEPVSYPPYDAPAGLLCDFAIHWDIVVNQVRTKVVATYDALVRRQAGHRPTPGGQLQGRGGNSGQQRPPVL
jgi:hypothetical protein